jgi:hypothetical protein
LCKFIFIKHIKIPPNIVYNRLLKKSIFFSKKIEQKS